MTTFDQHKNFAISTIVTAPAPPLTGLTLAVAAGEGALFPAAPFNAVVFPANSAPSVANGEIIRVTSKGAGDNWTVLRAQEGTAARSIQVGDRIANSITVKALTDIEAAVNAAGGSVALAAAPVLEPGLVGQVRAGRVLALADFSTLLALPSTPVGLFNLTDLSNLGTGGVLTNKGGATFGSGILGAAVEAAIFHGGVTDALYILDTGAADPFRIPYGSVGCWYRSAKVGATEQELISKYGSAAQFAYLFSVGADTANCISFGISTTGANRIAAVGVSNLNDDRWHFVVGTYDGVAISVYVDGLLEAVSLAASGPIFPGSSPFNLGAYGATGAVNATGPNFGRMDEAFVTQDVLSLEQIRMLYAARVPHSFGAIPLSAKVAVRRRRRGGTVPVATFSTQPLHLYNFTGGVLTDQGSLAVALTNNGVAVPAPGMDGAQGNAFRFDYAVPSYLSCTDAGLPAARTARSMGCWFKVSENGVMELLDYGTGGTSDFCLQIGNDSALRGGDQSGGVLLTSATVTTIVDGQPHLGVVTYDDAAADGLRLKLYADGKLVASSTSQITATVLAGANAFRIGYRQNGTVPLRGEIDAAFVTGYAMSAEEIATLYALGSQALGVSPKNAGDHVEGMDATSVYLIADGLDSQHLLDLEVAA